MKFCLRWGWTLTLFLMACQSSAPSEAANDNYASLQAFEAELIRQGNASSEMQLEMTVWEKSLLDSAGTRFGLDSTRKANFLKAIHGFQEERTQFEGKRIALLARVQPLLLDARLGDPGEGLSADELSLFDIQVTDRQRNLQSLKDQFAEVKALEEKAPEETPPPPPPVWVPQAPQPKATPPPVFEAPPISEEEEVLPELEEELPNDGE